jgi:hypothetical protein
MIEWKSYPENKPTNGSHCVVFNERWRRFDYLSFYSEQDFFLVRENGITGHPISITHFIELPELPRGFIPE